MRLQGPEPNEANYTGQAGYVPQSPTPSRHGWFAGFCQCPPPGQAQAGSGPLTPPARPSLPCCAIPFPHIAMSRTMTDIFIPFFPRSTDTQWTGSCHSSNSNHPIPTNLQYVHMHYVCMFQEKDFCLGKARHSTEVPHWYPTLQGLQTSWRICSQDLTCVSRLFSCIREITGPVTIQVPGQGGGNFLRAFLFGLPKKLSAFVQIPVH